MDWIILILLCVILLQLMEPKERKVGYWIIGIAAAISGVFLLVVYGSLWWKRLYSGFMRLRP